MATGDDVDEAATTGHPAPAVEKRAARQRPLHEAVVDRLRDMIIEGDLRVGDRLHDLNLAETLNVSRTPVREAIKLLATEGLVDLLPGRGARVAALSAQTVGELLEVIGGIERHACELAAERLTSRDLARLQRMHERMAGYHRAGDLHAYFKLNNEIHVAIVAAAKNATLAATHAALILKARRGRHTALASQARWAEAMAEHDLLMQALAARDGRKAGEIMLQHDLRTRAVVRQILQASEGR
ncbi:GntR family transcriptional regulator [Labrys wisconsinensis]|uniref:DNA-binding GntR family transcriptional regulator n=1 Tax=Labrys wisconsinensis TaxID=425677 RepID=A0ABU0JIU4_9HYPH|nr:GntR family transcriptional regulator [Labrys wisconsinensis]MDQ0474205.1 DNA-binding GntR family transcriptional regulator [Labrys wisconsinensis]